MFVIGSLMVVPALVAGGLFAAGAATVLGSYMNRTSQREANRANVIMQSRTNKLTEKLSREQNEFNAQQLLEQMKYLSPFEQRKMLEEAGYSPYAYLTMGGTSSPGLAQSAGIPNIHAPQVMPEDAFGRGVASFGQNLGSTFSSLADADLKGYQAEAQALENSVFSERTQRTFEAMDLGNAYQRIVNSYAGQEKELNLDLLRANKELTLRQCDQIELMNQIQSFYKDNIQPKELEELNQRINLLVEQGKSQISLREYYSALGHSALIQAHAQEAMAAINSFLAPFQARLLAANALDASEHAALNKALTDGQINENSLRRVFGVEFTQAQIDMLQSSKGVNQAMIENVYWQNKNLQKVVSYADFNNIVGALVPMGIAGKLFGVFGKATKIAGFSF